MIIYYLLMTTYKAAWLSGITFASKAKIESSILSAAVCASGSVVEHRLAKARAAGSNPVSRFYTLLMGCRQAVRHRVLIPAFAGSNPASPGFFQKYKFNLIMGYRQAVRQRILIPSFAGSNPASLAIINV